MENMTLIQFFALSTFVIFLFFMQAPIAGGQSYEPTWESLDSRPMPEWFNEAKLGIFIHWGVYSVPAWRPLSEARYASYAEWYYARVIDDLEKGGRAFHIKNYGEDFEYRDFAPMFKAELFDPDLFADLFYKAGAKYVVLTSKHHDGYCMWPTNNPHKKSWNCMDCGPKRDLLGDLTKSVRKKGLKMGLYYSLPDWESIPTERRDSGYFIDKKSAKKYGIPKERYVDEIAIPQLKELVQNYAPALIFSDGGEWDWDENFWKTKEFLAWLYNEAPNKDEVVVNDRWAKGVPGKHGDYYSSEYQDTDAVGTFHPWEESRGIGGSYGFNRAENIEDYHTSEQLIIELIDVVSSGGNLLLNVGPTVDGRVPVIMQQRLLDIGKWLKVNGEAIYGSGPCTKLTQEKKGIYFTKKDNDLYLIHHKWPEGKLTVKCSKYAKVKMLGLDENVPVEVIEDGLIITPPPISPARTPCKYAYVFKITNGLKGN